MTEPCSINNHTNTKLIQIQEELECPNRPMFNGATLVHSVRRPNYKWSRDVTDEEIKKRVNSLLTKNATWTEEPWTLTHNGNESSSQRNWLSSS